VLNYKEVGKLSGPLTFFVYLGKVEEQ